MFQNSKNLDRYIFKTLVNHSEYNLEPKFIINNSLINSVKSLLTFHQTSVITSPRIIYIQ